jgi:hypothetical protein
MVIGSFLCVGWYYLRDWKTTLHTKLTSSISAASHGLYDLTYDDITVNLLKGNLALKNVQLTPDSVRYRYLIGTKQAPNIRYHIRLANPKIQGLGIWSMLISKKLNIDGILLDSVNVYITPHQHTYNDSTRTESRGIYDNIKSTFKALRIKKTSIQQAHFKFLNVKDGKTDTTDIDNIQLNIYDFLLDKDSEHDSTRLFYAKYIETSILNFSYEIPNSPYKITAGHFKLDSKRQQAALYDIALIPKISKKQYFQSDKQNKALITLKFDSLLLSEIDFQKFAARNLLYAKYANLEGGSATFQKDKRYQKDTVNKIGQAPHQQVMKLNQLIRVDTIFVHDVDISYSEYSAKYQQTGTITFQKARGNITNLTNDTVQLRHDRLMRADLNAQLMGSGALHAEFGFDMLSKEGKHSYKGILGSMQAPAFNGILGPLLHIEFDSGNIRQIAFDVQATDDRHLGKFQFEYDSMRIKILDKHLPETESPKKTILSFLVNEFVINSSNPSPDGTLRIGQIDYTRVPEYSHFKSIWKALYEGIKQSVGLAQTDNTIDNPTEQRDTNPKSKNILEKTGDFFKRLFGNDGNSDDKREND